METFLFLSKAWILKTIIFMLPFKNGEGLKQRVLKNTAHLILHSCIPFWIANQLFSVQATEKLRKFMKSIFGYLLFSHTTPYLSSSFCTPSQPEVAFDVGCAGDGKRAYKPCRPWDCDTQGGFSANKIFVYTK